MEPTEEHLPDPEQPSVMEFYKSSRKRKGEGSQAATSGHSPAKKSRKSENRSESEEEDSSSDESDDEKAASDKVATVKQVLARSTGLKEKKDDSSSEESSSKEESCHVRNPQEAHHLSVQRCIQLLVHANQCRDTNCCLTSCQKMKRVIQHTRGCEKKTNGECPICKQLITLCCLHAKQCQEQACAVPFCINIKHKLRQQQLQQRLQQAQLLRRRIAAMTRQAPAA